MRKDFDEPVDIKIYFIEGNFKIVRNVIQIKTGSYIRVKYIAKDEKPHHHYYSKKDVRLIDKA